MSNKNKIPSNISIEQISIEISTCPGCGHEHMIVPSRPVTTKNCSYGTGTFVVSISSGAGQLNIGITFDNGQGARDVTRTCKITFNT